MDSKVLAAIILSSGMIVSSLIFFFAPKPGRYVYSFEDRDASSGLSSFRYCRDTCKGVTYAYSWSSFHNGFMKIDDKTNEILFRKRIDRETGKIDIERNKEF